MKTVQVDPKASDELDEMTARYLEDVCALFGHNIHIEDTDWQTVYDLTMIIVEQCATLGLIMKFKK